MLGSQDNQPNCEWICEVLFKKHARLHLRHCGVALCLGLPGCLECHDRRQCTNEESKRQLEVEAFLVRKALAECFDRDTCCALTGQKLGPLPTSPVGHNLLEQHQSGLTSSHRVIWMMTATKLNFPQLPQLQVPWALASSETL